MFYPLNLVSIMIIYLIYWNPLSPLYICSYYPSFLPPSLSRPSLLSSFLPFFLLLLLHLLPLSWLSVKDFAFFVCDYLPTLDIVFDKVLVRIIWPLG